MDSIFGITEQEFRRHLRADDIEQDERLLEDCLRDAEEQVLRDTNRTLGQMLELGGGTIPRGARRAALMLGAHYYETVSVAEGTEYKPIPYAYEHAIKSLTRIARGREEEG